MIRFDWPLITILMLLSLPGIILAVTRLIDFLLKSVPSRLKKRVQIIAVVQSVLMILVMSMAGSALSNMTGLGAPVLAAIVHTGAGWSLLLADILPVFIMTIAGLLLFLAIYYGLLSRLLDQPSFQAINQLRAALSLDACMLYSGITEEIIVRYGLVNLFVFLGMLFMKTQTPAMVWFAILLSSVLFTFSQLPVYVAAGCQFSRQLIYALLLSYGCQSILFGFIFWHYGLFAAIISHMLFHLGWWLYHKPSLT